MSEFYDSDIDEYLAYQEEGEYSDAEHAVQKDSERETGYSSESEYSCSSDTEEEEEEERENSKIPKMKNVIVMIVGKIIHI